MHHEKKVKVTDCGAPIESQFLLIIAVKDKAVLDLLHVEKEDPAMMLDFLDKPNKDSGADF